MAILTEEQLSWMFWGNSVEHYLTAIGVFLLTSAAIYIFKKVIVNRIEAFSKKTKNDVDDLVVQIINRIGWPFYAVVSFFVAGKWLALPNIADTVLNYALLITFVFYAVLGVQRIITYSADKIIAKRQAEAPEGTEADTGIIWFISRFIKLTLWFIAVLLILSNMGYNVSTLIAGLGIGGIAIGLALQNILGDLFASVSIYFDKPFQPGDFIIIGNDMGTVKKIGIKSTRIEALTGQELVVSNTELTSTRVNNYKKMEKRRIVTSFGVTYDTSSEKLKRILDIVKEVFENIKEADLDRVHFKAFGDFSLNYEVVYYVATQDYALYMDVQQDFNFQLKEKFEQEGIEFAYPTQTIYLNKEEGQE